MPWRNLHLPRRWRRLTNDPLRPRRWPVMQGVMAWDGHLLDQQEGVCQLDSTEVAEIGRALEGFKNMDLDGPEIGTGNFSLPTLGPKLAECAKYIHSERGFCIIRGLDPSIYSVEDGTLVFLGISSYIGEQRASQDGFLNMITHICEPVEKESVSHRFHSESVSCHLVAFQVCSKHDEIVKLASSWHVYNQLQATKPEVLEEFANIAEKKKSKTDQHQKPSSSFAQEAYRTELFLCDGKVILRASGQNPMRAFFETYNVGPVGDVERMAQDSCTRLILKPGDLLFINNLAVLHAIEDTRQGERHLVKLWLRNERLAWELPRGFQEYMDALYDRRELSRVWALRPTKRNQSKSGGGEGKEVTIKGRVEAPEGDDDDDDDDDGSIIGISIGGGSVGGGSMGGGSIGGGAGSMGGWS